MCVCACVYVLARPLARRLGNQANPLMGSSIPPPRSMNFPLDSYNSSFLIPSPQPTTHTSLHLVPCKVNSLSSVTFEEYETSSHHLSTGRPIMPCSTRFTRSPGAAPFHTMPCEIVVSRMSALVNATKVVHTRQPLSPSLFFHHAPRQISPTSSSSL